MMDDVRSLERLCGVHICSLENAKASRSCSDDAGRFVLEQQLPFRHFVVWSELSRTGGVVCCNGFRLLRELCIRTVSGAHASC